MFYNNFLIYLNNKNYQLEREDRNYKFKLKNKNTSLDYLQVFNDFVELYQDLFNLITTNKLVFKSDIEISYELTYGNSVKVANNSFIFVFSYSFQQFYKNFKESFNLYEIKENIENFKLLYDRYVSISNEINSLYDLNYKFYDLNDFNFEAFNLSNLSMSKNILRIRKYITNSIRDFTVESIDRTNYLRLINEVFEINFTNTELTELESLDTDIINIHSTIHISKGFKFFLSQIVRYIIDNQEDTLLKDNLKTIFALLYTIYNIHYLNNQSNINFSKTIILHNNLESFVFMLHILSLFNLIAESNTQLREFLADIKINFKNYCTKILSQVFSNFIAGLSEELSTVESLNEIKYDRISKKVERMLKNCSELLIKFFDYFKEYANEKDFLFYLNYTLSLFFDLLNKKILYVNDYSDLKIIEKIFGSYSNELKKSFEAMFENNNTMKEKFIDLLEGNIKFKKYEEIFIILNASRLDKISKFLQASNYHIHLDSNELIELICTIFSESAEREKLISNIKEHLNL
jgi:hypothetical protein